MENQEEFKELVELAAKSLEDKWAAKDASRARRAQSQGLQGKEMEKRRKKALTQMLAPFAALGDIDGMKKALAGGACLEAAAAEKGRQPLMAALEGGHEAAALWLLANGALLETALRAEERGEKEAAAAVRSDLPEALATIIKASPKALRRCTWYGDQHCESALQAALSFAPKCAAWMIEHRGDDAANMGFPDPDAMNKAFCWQSNKIPKYGHGALAAALGDRSWAVAEALLKFLQIKAESKFFAEGGEALRLLEALFKADDAQALAWLLRSSPEMGRFVQGGVSAAWGLKSVEEHACWPRRAFPAEDKLLGACQELLREGDGGRRSSSMLWAALEGAQECFELLSRIPPCARTFRELQRKQGGGCWIQAYAQINDSKMAEAMERAGFSFDKEASPGWNYPAILMAARIVKPSAPWLAWIQKSKPNLLRARRQDGLGPFELGQMAGKQCPKSLKPSPSDIEKWAVSFEREQISATTEHALPAAAGGKMRL